MYEQFRSILNANKPNRITYFSIDSESDYYNQETEITVTIQYSYCSTYDDWSDYSYAIAQARRLIYRAWDQTFGRYPSSYTLKEIKEENVYDGD